MLNPHHTGTIRRSFSRNASSIRIQRSRLLYCPHNHHPRQQMPHTQYGYQHLHIHSQQNHQHHHHNQLQQQQQQQRSNGGGVSTQNFNGTWLKDNNSNNTDNWNLLGQKQNKTKSNL